MVKITRWQRLNHAGDSLASFNFVLQGITVRAATLLRRRDGSYGVGMPFTRHRNPATGGELAAIRLDYDLEQAVLAAATDRYGRSRAVAMNVSARRPEPANDDYSVVRRIVRADVGEACERAGL